MSEINKMLKGELYDANDLDLANKRTDTRKLLDEINNTKYEDINKTNKLFKKLFGKIGKDFNISKPFYCDYGKNIKIGNNFYANYDCIFLDVNEIIIGNNVFLAPRVAIYTAAHPIDKDVRSRGLEFGKKVLIGNDVWIGGNVVINPGVTIGNNIVIGSGSVVSSNIPSDVVAFGNPCRIYRKITKADKDFWENKEKTYHLEAK